MFSSNVGFGVLCATITATLRVSHCKVVVEVVPLSLLKQCLVIWACQINFIVTAKVRNANLNLESGDIGAARTELFALGL
ncbi:MAG: hypothetical protein OSB38_35260 [Paraburkholderia fungorum]|nr:hypothetical protein [Paraburkholderia fungorum]